MYIVAATNGLMLQPYRALHLFQWQSDVVHPVVTLLLIYV
jgi:hypothetical protein